MSEIESKVFFHLEELAKKDTGYRVGPRSVARLIGESEEDVEDTFNALVAKGKVRVFENFGQEYWGVK